LATTVTLVAGTSYWLIVAMDYVLRLAAGNGANASQLITASLLVETSWQKRKI
jgi:hypothetical protein